MPRRHQSFLVRQRNILSCLNGRNGRPDTNHSHNSSDQYLTFRQNGNFQQYVAYELFQTADQYRSMGADIPENITVDDADKVIDAIEAWEDLQKELAEEAAQIPSAEERIAAVLEEQQMDAQLANM